MTRYIVIENIPGYIPEDDDPFITDDHRSAVRYMLERMRDYRDSIIEGEGEPVVSCERLGWGFISDATREHDLGRVFSVCPCEDEDD